MNGVEKVVNGNKCYRRFNKDGKYMGRWLYMLIWSMLENDSC